MRHQITITNNKVKNNLGGLSGPISTDLNSIKRDSQDKINSIALLQWVTRIILGTPFSIASARHFAIATNSDITTDRENSLKFDIARIILPLAPLTQPSKPTRN